jgi:hypothetical protein
VNRFKRYHPRFSLVKYFSNPKEQFLTMQGMVIGLDITPEFSYVTPVLCMIFLICVPSGREDHGHCFREAEQVTVRGDGLLRFLYSRRGGAAENSSG